MAKEIISTNNPSITAEVSPDKLKSLFYLFAGKPDSRIKVFSNPIHIKHNDLIELNNNVIRKLSLHSIGISVTTVKVGYVGQNLSEFGTWFEFETHHWEEPDQVEEIIIKWDFLVNIQEYAAPQRHTLLVRISSEIKTGKILQMLSSGNSDEFDQIDTLSEPAFCRVDFINAQLSKELINVVDDWYKGRIAPILIPEFLYWAKKNRKAIALLIDHWIMLSWVLGLIAVSLYLIDKELDSSIPLHIAAVGTFFAIYTLVPISRIANTVGAHIFNTLRNIQGSKVVFEFTSGDKKRIAELESRNKEKGNKFFITISSQIIVNIIASVISVIVTSNLL